MVRGASGMRFKDPRYLSVLRESCDAYELAEIIAGVDAVIRAV